MDCPRLAWWQEFGAYVCEAATAPADAGVHFRTPGSGNPLAEVLDCSRWHMRVSIAPTLSAVGMRRARKLLGCLKKSSAVCWIEKPLSGEQRLGDIRITIADGLYYWTSHDNRLLTLSASGDFTYLSSTEPGRYIRFRKVNDKISYIEHVDGNVGSVTYWGELRIVVGKQP